MLSSEQSKQEVVIERAVKTTIQILYDTGCFDSFDNAEEVLQDYLINERRRPKLDDLDDVYVIH